MNAAPAGRYPGGRFAFQGVWPSHSASAGGGSANSAAAARAGLNRSGYLTQAALIQARRDRGLGARPDEETA